MVAGVLAFPLVAMLAACGAGGSADGTAEGTGSPEPVPATTVGPSPAEGFAAELRALAEVSSVSVVPLPSRDGDGTARFDVTLAGRELGGLASFADQVGGLVAAKSVSEAETWQIWVHALNPVGAGITVQLHAGHVELAAQADALAATPGVAAVSLAAAGPSSVQVKEPGDLDRVARVVAARGIDVDTVTTVDGEAQRPVSAQLRADEARNLELAELVRKTRWPADHDAPPCAADELVPFLGTGEGATGHQYAYVTAANIGDRPCAVSGYPVLEFRDLAGDVVPIKLSHGSSFMATDDGPRRLVVPPGASVRAELGWDRVDSATMDAPPAQWVSEVVVTATPGADPVELPGSLRVDAIGGFIGGTEIRLTAWKPNFFTS